MMSSKIPPISALGTIKASQLASIHAETFGVMPKTPPLEYAYNSTVYAITAACCSQLADLWAVDIPEILVSVTDIV